MLNHLLVRLTIGCLLVLGIKLSALYFYLWCFCLILITKSFSVGNKKTEPTGLRFLYRFQRGEAVAFVRLQYVY
ncbi:hypothetical protein VCSRO193_0931 [Vibrio cholerae]|nr:hypothetical protein VCSRO193_0931 [Vibrio cholerae]